VVAYSTRHRNFPCATPRHHLPPNPHATFYATIGQKPLYLSAKPRFGTILLGELRLFSHEPA
jgi:hypothetical protein